MRYEVTSIKTVPSNGGVPFRKKLSARSPRLAAEKAYCIGGGAILKIAEIDSNPSDGRYEFAVLTTKGVHMRVVVEEIRWYEFWKIIT